jgi:hypothetical protein
LKPANQAIICVVAGCLTPIGIDGLTSVFRFKSSTSIIAEWANTSISDIGTWALIAVVAALLVGWARAADRVPWGEVIYALAWMFFSLFAYRNTFPATLLLAPLAAYRLGSVLRLPAQTRGDRERQLLAVGALSLMLIGIGATAYRVATSPTIPKDVPRHLISVLREQPGEHRVLNDYNRSGQIIAFGGPDTKVAVDGRSDLYGGPYLDRYMSMLALGKDWRETLAEVDPNYAFLRASAPIVYALRHEGWTTVDTQGKYVLLAEPGTA